MSSITYFITSANLFTPVLTITTNTINNFALEIYNSILFIFNFFTTSLVTQLTNIISRIYIHAYKFEFSDNHKIITIIALSLFSLIICDKILQIYIYYSSIPEKLKHMEKEIKKLKNENELQNIKYEVFVKITENQQNSLNQLYKKFNSYDKELKKMNKEIRKYE
jgi:hypothetical protein